MKDRTGQEYYTVELTQPSTKNKFTIRLSPGRQAQRALGLSGRQRRKLRKRERRADGLR